MSRARHPSSPLLLYDKTLTLENPRPRGPLCCRRSMQGLMPVLKLHGQGCNALSAGGSWV